ncbi:MAG: hypothetical protein JXB07_11205 [Anaerolineae bacterium]|nr:hypothetical protein [Anaerolineae bacterium]
MVHETDIRKRIAVGFFVLLSLMVPALIGYTVYDQWSTPTMDFILDNPGSSIVHEVIAGGHSDAAGLRIGDVILTVDDISFKYWHAPHIGQTHLLKIERRGERLVLGVPAVRVIDVSFLSLSSAVITAATFWGVSTLLLWRRFRYTEIRLLFLLFQALSLTLLVQLSYRPPWQPPFAMRALSLVSFNLSAPLLLHHVMMFPVKFEHPRRRFWWLLPLYILAPMVFVVYLLDVVVGIQLSVLFLSLITAVGIFCLAYIYHYRAGSDDRRRLRVIVMGLLVAGLSPVLFYWLPTSIQSSFAIPKWAASLFLIVAPLSYLYVILRHNLFGIDRLINRALVYAILSVGIFVLYLVPYLLLYRYLPDDLFIQLVIVSGLTLWVGWTFDWMRARIQRIIDHIFYGGWYDYPVVVEAVSDALARSVQREQILEVLTCQVPRLMRLTQARLWFGDTNAAQSALSQSFRFDFQSDVPAGWMVGPHRDGDDLSDIDHRILRTLAQQAEIALNNVLMIEKLHRQLDEIRSSREALVQVQHQLLRSREEERARLARDLHDGPIQALVGLNIQLGLLLGSSEIAPSARQAITEMRAEVKQLSQELRQVCVDLRPPMLDALGLGAALRAHAEEWSAQYGVETQLDLSPDASLISLPGEVAVNLYRVAQEVLVNTGKHAQARQVNISLGWKDGQLLMTIQDDGRGFDPPDTLHKLTAQEHFGLAGMKERVELIGGQWSLRSVPGKGTIVCVTWAPMVHD